MNQLKELGQTIQDSSLGLKMGIKQAPQWDCIATKNLNIPLIHAWIGIGNDLLENFQEEIKSCDQKKHRTRRAMTTAEHKIIGEISKMDGQDASADGLKLKSLEGMYSKQKTAIKKLEALIRITTDVNNTNSD